MYISWEPHVAKKINISLNYFISISYAFLYLKVKYFPPNEKKIPRYKVVKLPSFLQDLLWGWPSRLEIMLITQQASKLPSLNTDYMFLCTFGTISRQMPTFPDKELPKFLTFPTVLIIRLWLALCQKYYW